ncbi:MAG: hypothetical protein IPM52_01290 [Bacteroidetes bacterium]|nr:hypothetical protein [Bacteroidota bacterium]
MHQLRPGCHPLCRACPHRQLSAEQSLMQKLTFLRQKLHPWANLLMPVQSLPDDLRWGYRSKTTLGTAFSNGQWTWGLWRGDDLLHIPDCPVHQPYVNEVFKLVMSALPAYDFGLRWLVLSGAQLTLVIKDRRNPLGDWPEVALFKALTAWGIEGLWLHLNPSTGKRIFGKGGWQLLNGSPVSVDSFGLRYGPAAFSQLIPELYLKALQAAFGFFQPDEGMAVVDLYCGTGSSMKRWSEAGARVIGVEAAPEAARLAALNLPDVTVLTGACRQRLPQLDLWCREQLAEGRSLVLYANPPRMGIETEVMEWIVQKARPLKLAYLSCSPGTLSRDLKLLCEGGYQIHSLLPFDFFPQTRHVETLALLSLSS